MKKLLLFSLLIVSSLFGMEKQNTSNTLSPKLQTAIENLDITSLLAFNVKFNKNHTSSAKCFLLRSRQSATFKTMMLKAISPLVICQMIELYVIQLNINNPFENLNSETVGSNISKQSQLIAQYIVNRKQGETFAASHYDLQDNTLNEMKEAFIESLTKSIQDYPVDSIDIIIKNLNKNPLNILQKIVFTKIEELKENNNAINITLEKTFTQQTQYAETIESEKPLTTTKRLRLVRKKQIPRKQTVKDLIVNFEELSKQNTQQSTFFRNLRR